MRINATRKQLHGNAGRALAHNASKNDLTDNYDQYIDREGDSPHRDPDKYVRQRKPPIHKNPHRLNAKNIDLYNPS